MEVLGGRRGLGQAHVAPGAQGEEPFDARRRMLGALTFVSVRQKEDQTRLLVPLVGGRHQEVIDHDLGTVGEITELRLPRHQSVGHLDRVAVLEAQRRILRQEGVVDPEAPDTVALEVGQRHPLVPGGVVDEHGMALTERPPARVLSCQPHVGALEE